MIQFKINICIGEDDNTRTFRFEDYDDVFAADWNEKIEDLTNDLKDFIADKNDN